MLPNENFSIRNPLDEITTCCGVSPNSEIARNSANTCPIREHVHVMENTIGLVSADGHAPSALITVISPNPNHLAWLY
jgi:hypothetical protein